MIFFKINNFEKVSMLDKVPDIRWIMPQWFEGNALGIVAGPAGFGKTTCCIKLAVLNAQGPPSVSRCSRGI